MILKPSSKNTAKPILPKILPIFLSLLILGCYSAETTYKQKEIASWIERICLQEYNIKVLVKESSNTLWVYYPLSKILSSDFYKTGKPFDENFLEQLRHIWSTIGRVLLSADKTPDFYVLVASDIKNGFDYFFAGYILDLKKLYGGYLPQAEFDKRYILNVNVNKESIGVTSGKHIKITDITLAQFLTQQIVQRINYRIYELLKARPKFLDGNFNDEVFRFEYEMDKLSYGRINLTDEFFKIISFVLKDYEFKDFLVVEVENKLTNEVRTLGRHALFAEFK